MTAPGPTVGSQRLSPAPLLALGLATGVLSGLLGIGGGVIMVPALVALGVGRHVANAISLATILLIAVSGAVGFAISGAIDVPVGLALGAGGTIGATLGARWAHRMSSRTLARLFGVLLALVGVRMLVGGAPNPADVSIALIGTLSIAGVLGLGTGVLSGIAGVGGGVVMVPALVFGLGMTQHVAEGTSLLAIVFTAAAGTRVNQANGYVRWRPVSLLAVTGVAAAPLAALFAQEIPASVLTRIFGVWLLLTAGRTLWTTRSDPASS